jgi:antitoxin ParD1/3/4
MATEEDLTTMNISLPEGLRAFIAKQVRQGGYTSASEYLRHLVRTAQETVEIETKLLAALEQGRPLRIDERYWRDKDSRVADLIRRKARKKA